MAGETVLVFDDDEFFRTVLAEILLDEELQVTSHADPGHYRACPGHCPLQGDTDRCQRATPCHDFLLTDNQMPSITGVEFLSQLKRMGCKIPDRRKAVISADWNHKDCAKIQQLGSQTFNKFSSSEQIHAWIAESRKNR